MFLLRLDQLLLPPVGHKQMSYWNAVVYLPVAVVIVGYVVVVVVAGRRLDL